MTTLNFPRPMGVRLAEYERAGYRPLAGDEADEIKYGQSVYILDNGTGDHISGKVIGCADDKIRVALKSGCILIFDTDNPDYWGDGEVRDRKPPIAIEDGVEFVIVTDRPPMASAEPAKAELFNALRATSMILKLQQQVTEMEAKQDALLADMETLRQQVNAQASARVA